MEKKSQVRYKLLAGFTLIEIMVVVGIMALLATAGMAMYTSFEAKQRLVGAGKQFVNVLRDAQKRAQSGEKPAVADCASPITLDGWVVRQVDANNFLVAAICGGTEVPSTRVTTTLPTTVSFVNNFNFQFSVLTGKVTGAGSIIFNSGTLRYKIDVTQAGGVDDTGSCVEGQNGC